MTIEEHGLVYWIINMVTKTYVEVMGLRLEGSWHKMFPHTREQEPDEVMAVHIAPLTQSYGIPFEESMTPGGAQFMLYVNPAIHTEQDVQLAKNRLRRTRDAVKVSVTRVQHYDVSKPPVGYGIESCLVLSTAHMPSPRPDFGEALICESATTAFLWPSENVPEWLRPIVSYAIAFGISYIVFDPDGLQNNLFKVYDWAA